MFSFFFILCRYVSGFNVTLEYMVRTSCDSRSWFLLSCSVPSLGFDRLFWASDFAFLLPINKRLTSKTFKIAKTAAKLVKYHQPFIFSSVNVERAYKNKNRKRFTDRQRMGSLWGETHTLFETALPCIIDAGGFRVMFWRFYYWKTAVCAWCCFLVCQD